MQVIDQIKTFSNNVLQRVAVYAIEAMKDNDQMSARIKSHFAPASMGQQSGFQRAVLPGFEEFDRISIKNDRNSKLRETAQMVNTDPRVDRLLYKLTSDASFGSYQVVVEDAESESIKDNAQEIINRTRMLIRDKELFKGWSKGLLRDGDLFLQLYAEKKGKEKEIIRAKKLDAMMTFTRMTSEGDFPKDKMPYYQEDPNNHEIVVKEFEQWEIVHIKWDDEDGKPYGKPLFASSRLAWRRLTDGERDIAIRRRIRAGQRRKHTLGTMDSPAKWDEVEEYKRKNQDAIDNPENSSQDWFSNGRALIETLEGDSRLGEITDLTHHEGLLWIATGVPQALTSGGRESATNFSVIKEQEEDYLRVVGDINQAMEKALRQIFDSALLLKEIDPDSIIYTFKFGAKDREDVDKKIDRAVKLQRSRVLV